MTSLDELRQTPLGRVIDRLREAGVEPVVHRGRDGRALKDSGADPDEVAEAFLAARARRWGSRYLWENLTIHAVVQALNSYRAWRESAAKRTDFDRYAMQV